ncbi:Alpha-L-Rha alpha-1,3-L-rhamnosyltransferase [Candidatus Rhodobacter oscarellae]|uniref:Alpha-L-Rha alpha-1,3-L-rhamnosyltransferase n=1 Tax=Candidatus Rhodobacter oscarellae TaxID=1675527 RepID=A0A0J9EAM2_9RHOB|nr:glycosyltransferase [Candidatus Rhodobacter lobularis]KMW59837.1 Alpha-L-Rha alpha-1,3-L-rhamnosyltransferase [Candidatus Rhodobacter lobularis]
MATHFGAAFIDAQLGSIAEQSHKDWSLWVSDDGSSDATRSRIDAFARAHPEHEVQLFDGPQMGAAANFLSLLARLKPGERHFVALADQDDVWFPDKLGRALRALEPLDDAPAVYASAQTYTDAALSNPRPSRAYPRGPSFSNALLQNILSGSSIVLTPNAVDLLASVLPDQAPKFLDWWIYQVMTGCEAHVIYDPEPSLFYRQHSGNILGEGHGLRARARRVLLLYGSGYRAWLDAQLPALERAKGQFSAENQRVFERFLAARQGFAPKRPVALWRTGVHRQSPLETALLLSASAFGRL